LADEQQATLLLHQQLRTQLTKLDVQEENLLDLAADAALPKAKLKQRLLRVAQQREQITADLANVRLNVDAGARVVEAALRLLERPDELYQAMDGQGAGPSEPEPSDLQQAVPVPGRGHRGRTEDSVRRPGRGLPGRNGRGDRATASTGTEIRTGYDKRPIGSDLPSASSWN
jgi:hypothetical protein